MVGIGGLGHLGIQYAKAMGCKVVAIDNRKEAIDLANSLPENLKPDQTHLTDSDEASKKVAETLLGSFYNTNPGVDRVIINAEEPTLVKFSQQFTRKGGIIVDVGLPSDSSFRVDPFALNFKEQTIKGRVICKSEQSRDMIDLHAKHGCKVHVKKTYKVDEINDMLEHYKSKQLQGRVCMVF
jgi:propanol-preferring alcohol dehydrogenase